MLPERVVRALNLDLNEIAASSRLHSVFVIGSGEFIKTVTNFFFIDFEYFLCIMVQTELPKGYLEYGAHKRPLRRTNSRAMCGCRLIGLTSWIRLEGIGNWWPFWTKMEAVRHKKIVFLFRVLW